MFKILECANVLFLRVPNFKVENCIEFALNIRIAHYGKLA